MPLDRLPVGDCIVRACRDLVAEDMSMAAHKLVHQPAQHILARKFAIIFAEPYLKYHMEQHIAEFFEHLGGVAFLDCLDEFVALFQEILCQRLSRLLLVPRAAIGSQQPRQHLFDAFVGGGVSNG